MYANSKWVLRNLFRVTLLISSGDIISYRPGFETVWKVTFFGLK